MVSSTRTERRIHQEPVGEVKLVRARRVKTLVGSVEKVRDVEPVEERWEAKENKEEGEETEEGLPSYQPELLPDEEVLMPSYQPAHGDDSSSSLEKEEDKDEDEDEEELEPVDLVGWYPVISKSTVKDSFGSDLFDGIDISALDPVQPPPTITRPIAPPKIPYPPNFPSEVKKSQSSNPPELELPELGPSAVINGQDAYIVEAIVGEKRPRNRRQRSSYLVKWLGYPEEENTWETGERLRKDLGREGLEEIVRVFREASGGDQKRRKVTNSTEVGAERVGETSFARMEGKVVEEELELLEIPRPSQMVSLSSAQVSLPSFSTVNLTPEPEEVPQEEEPLASHPTPRAERQSSVRFVAVDKIPASNSFSSPRVSSSPPPASAQQQSQTISPPLSSPTSTPSSPRKRPPDELTPPPAKRLHAPTAIDIWPSQTAEEFNRAYLNWRPEGWKQSVQNPDFLTNFFQESRLHQLSTWRSELKARIQSIPAPLRPKIDYLRRYVMHIDFDCFFAAVSTRDQPQHAEKPVAISHGSSDSSEIASCNYIARGFGVKNGMWMSTARKLCPGIIVLPYEFAKYEAASREFYDVVLSLNALKVQAVSIDEVLVDVTNLICHPTQPDIEGEETRALELATKIRNICRDKTNCEVSIGIGPNILLAKLALRAAKPAGQYILRTSSTASFLATKNVRDLPSIGPKTSELILRSFGTEAIADLRDIKASRLCAVLGPKAGQRVYELCRGVDPTPVGAANEIERKSYSINVNWGVRFISADQPERFVRDLCIELEKRMEEDGVVGSSLVVTIAVRHPQANRRTEKWLGCGKTESMARSVSLMEPTAEAEVMARAAARIVRELGVQAGEIRGVGVAMGRVERWRGRGQGRLGFAAMEKVSPKKGIHEPQPLRTDEEAQKPYSQAKLPPGATGLRFQLSKPASLIGRFLTSNPPAMTKPTPLSINPQPKPQPLDTSPQEFSSTQFLIPTQVDLSVLAALPPEIQAQYHARQKSSLPPQLTAPVPSSPPASLPPPPSPPDAPVTDQLKLRAIPASPLPATIMTVKTLPSSPSPQLSSDWDDILKGMATQERQFNQNWEREIKRATTTTPSKRKEKHPQLYLSPSPRKVKEQVPEMLLACVKPPVFPLFQSGGNSGNAGRAHKSSINATTSSTKPSRTRNNPTHETTYATTAHTKLPTKLRKHPPKPAPRNPHHPNPSLRPAFHPDGTDISPWLYLYTHITPTLFHILERQDQITVIRAAEKKREVLKTRWEKERDRRRQVLFAVERAVRVKVRGEVRWACGHRFVGSRDEEGVREIVREWVRSDGWRLGGMVQQVQEEAEEGDWEACYGLGCGPWCEAGFWGDGSRTEGYDLGLSTPYTPSYSPGSSSSSSSFSSSSSSLPTSRPPPPYPHSPPITSHGPDPTHLTDWLSFLTGIVLRERDMYKAVCFVKTFLSAAGWVDGWGYACAETVRVLGEAAERRGVGGVVEGLRVGGWVRDE